MQKRRFIPLFRPDAGKIARACLVALFAGMFSVTAFAQTDEYGLPLKGNYNSDVRTGTWSIYAQGGLSWATDVWYDNINAKKSYNWSPAVGGGVDYTIRPWVRVGAEYLWSKYRREQRITALDYSSMPMKAYGNYHVNYHNIKLGAGFNFMEIWPERNSQWFNIWVGTGAGYMLSKGNEYSCYFNTTIIEDGVSKPVTGGINVSNTSSISIHGNVRTTNDHSSFNRFYIPASLHFEFDVTRQLTMGVKGEMDWVLAREEAAPKSLVFGMATLRYNFVKSKANKMKTHYDSRFAAMDSELKEAMRKAEAQKARAEKAEAECAQMAKVNSAVQKSLDECQRSKENMVNVKPEYKVLFDNNDSIISSDQTESLKEFALKHSGRSLSLVAEASASGSKEHNQRLSERRLEEVIKALQGIGFTEEQLKPRIAIGAQRGIDSPEVRCVTITVE